MDRARLSGLWPPIATPFAADGSVDNRCLLTLARRLLKEGARGLVVLGTTGEANSLGLGERHALIDAMVEGGVQPGQLIVGTGACAIPDAVELTRHARDVGAAAVLLLPPFYYKPVSDDGLFAFVAEVIRQAGPAVPPVLLYHFPSLAVVGWSLGLVGALTRAFPEAIAGLKDSSGDDQHTVDLIAAFPDLAILPGSDGNLLTATRAGAPGFITTSGNVNARAIAALIGNPTARDADARLAEANAIRNALKARGLFPSVKAVLARQMRDDAWLAMRPPLVPLSSEARAALYAEPAIARLLDQVPAVG
jgi:4-hydroxy-tetrahydrodipicolinate synthase